MFVATPGPGRCRGTPPLFTDAVFIPGSPPLFPGPGLRERLRPSRSAGIESPVTFKRPRRPGMANRDSDRDSVNKQVQVQNQRQALHQLQR